MWLILWEVAGDVSRYIVQMMPCVLAGAVLFFSCALSASGALRARDWRVRPFGRWGSSSLCFSVPGWLL